MKQKSLKLTPEALIRAIQGKPDQLNLPADLELIDIKYDAFSKQVSVVVRSDTFEDVTEGLPTPELAHDTPTQHQTPEPVPAPTSEPIVAPKTPAPAQPAPVSPQKTIIQTLTASTQPAKPSSIGTGVKTLGPKPEANQSTGGLEDEFTREQRKVLRFTSDGDYVIVKPIQFLKTEWEDINDTVKSIGGKWVKGSIIDYWVIPKNPKKEEQ
jgi:hypothetical protein